MINRTSSFDTGGDIYAMGNGKILIFGRGWEITVRCPSYYSDAVCSISTAPENSVFSEGVTERVSDTVYRHISSTAEEKDTGNPKKNKKIRQTVLTDYVDYERCIFIRETNSAFRLDLDVGTFSKGGSQLFINYRINNARYNCIVISLPGGERLMLCLCGKCVVSRSGENKFKIFVSTGETKLIIAAGTPDIARRNVATAINGLKKADNNQIYINTLNRSNAETERVMPAAQRISEPFSEADGVDETVLSVAGMLTGMQSESGGLPDDAASVTVSVTSQCAAVDAFLLLGLYERAQKALEYLFNTWKKSRALPYAVTLDGREGLPSDTLGVGYGSELIHSALNYALQTGDQSFVRKIFPMLSWALSAQTAQLSSGMLPFTGTEGSIAFRRLPGCYMENGSATNTFRYVAAGERLFTYAGQHGLRIPGKRGIAGAVKAAERGFAGNFVRNGFVFSNSPERSTRERSRRFRLGVCDFCDGTQQTCGMVMTERTRGGRYACAACYEKILGTLTTDNEYYLGERYTFIGDASALLEYEGCVDREIKLDTLRPFALAFEINRFVSSDLIEDVSYPGDAALFLTALVRTGSPVCDDMADVLLRTRNGLGIWSEYTRRNTAGGKQCCVLTNSKNLSALAAYSDFKRKSTGISEP